MKFECGEVLYYVNPFVFVIDAVRIEYAYKEEDGTIFYIDHSGAYLREEELFKTLRTAQQDTIKRLEKFYFECKEQIINCNPNFREEL